MKRILLNLALLSVAGMAHAAEPAVASSAAEVKTSPLQAATAALEAGKLNVAETQATQIADPAAKLFVTAQVLRAQGDAKAAIKTLSHLTVEYPNAGDWIAQADFLSAELYLELGLLDEADATAGQVTALYAGTDFDKKAQALRVTIKESKTKLDKKGELNHE